MFLIVLVPYAVRAAHSCRDECCSCFCAAESRPRRTARSRTGHVNAPRSRPPGIRLPHCPLRLAFSSHPHATHSVPARWPIHRRALFTVLYHILPLPHAHLPHARRCERFSSDSRENYLFTCIHKQKNTKCSGFSTKNFFFYFAEAQIKSISANISRTAGAA